MGTSKLRCRCIDSALLLSKTPSKIGRQTTTVPPAH
jgi:hypothetical protein